MLKEIDLKDVSEGVLDALCDILNVSRTVLYSRGLEFYLYENPEQHIIFKWENSYIIFFYEEEELSYISFMTLNNGKLKLIAFDTYVVNYDEDGLVFAFDDDSNKMDDDNYRLLEKFMLEDGKALYQQYNMATGEQACLVYEISHRGKINWDVKPFGVSITQGNKLYTLNKYDEDGSYYEANFEELLSYPKIVPYCFTSKTVNESLQGKGFKTSVPEYIRRYLNEDYLTSLECQGIANAIMMGKMVRQVLSKRFKGDIADE